MRPLHRAPPLSLLLLPAALFPIEIEIALPQMLLELVGPTTTSSRLQQLQQQRDGSGGAQHS